MAIGWLTVLKAVPWAEVVGNAPRIAEGAKSLWSAIGRKRAGPAAGAGGIQPVATAAPASLATLQAQLAATQATVAELHNQMRQSAELIKALAEQNTQLVERIEANRRRTLWLAVITMMIGVVAVMALTSGG